MTTKQRAAWALWLATSAGALAAAAARAAPAGRLWLVLTTLFAAGVFNLGYGAWTALQERLYLATIPVGTLRCALSAAAALPLLHGVLAELGAFGLVRGLPRLPRAAGWALAGAATLAASRGLSGVDAALLLVATATAALPWLTRPGENPAAILLRDAPALLATAALGLGAGLLPATLWRLAVLAGDAPLHLRSAGRAPAFATFALLLSLPVAAEAALRATSLAQGWSPDALAGASVGEGVARVAAPFWTGSCGDAPRHPVWVFGGSATGGAWQFRGHPEAFFPAALHDRLCAAGLAVETVNYGDSGRDTFDIRQMLPSLLGGAHPDLVVLYVGVNDLFTLDAPVTRKERAALLAARGATLSTVGTLAAKSRLFTGLSLLVRPVTTHAAVVSVPLPDAEENVRAVLAAVKAAGGKVLLAPELVRTAEAAGMLGYAKMLQTVCDDTAAVCVDPAPTFALDRDTFLVDRNHLSESGAAKLADALFPAAVGALGLTGAPPAAAAPPRSPR